MNIKHAAAWSVLLATCVLAQRGIDVGTGSPDEGVRGSFVNAFFRKLFYTLVSMPPIGEVRRLGATGYVQEFNDAARTPGVRLALIKPNGSIITPEGTDVFQMLAPMYNYYSSVGVNTAGYPTQDTQVCPPTTDAPCQYQIFDKSHVLFAYLQPIANGQNFAVKDAFYTRWRDLGGINGLGAVNSGESTVSSTFGSQGTAQTFSQGAIVNITAGVLTGRLVSIQPTIYKVFVESGSFTGALGFPTGEESVLPDGRRRQAFEGGSVEYTPGNPPVLRPPVASVSLTAAGSNISLGLNETLQVRATPYSIRGDELLDRTVVFVTSNSRVVAIQSSGLSATLRAVGAGTARVTAVADGKTSLPIAITVVSPCCGIGEGAPTTQIQQAFQDVVTRQRLNVRLPASGPVRRLGAGYVQYLDSLEPNGPEYLIAVPDRSTVGFLVTGDLLARYQALGGPSQALGYPSADAVMNGGSSRQLFSGGALAGNPVRLVTGLILQRWASTGYESGPFGRPRTEAQTLTSTSGLTASMQSFSSADLYAIPLLSTRASAVTEPVLSAYNSNGGPGGSIGLPLSDESAVSGRRRQEFENAYLEYAPDVREVSILPKQLRPQINAMPSSVLPGGRVRLAVTGFPPGSTVRVSVAGQPEFSITLPNGAYYWDRSIPASSTAATVRLQAVDGASASNRAEGSYTVRSFSEARIEVAKAGGDEQTGPPGAVLPQRLAVQVRDENGQPLAGLPVVFAPSPGGEILEASELTDENGHASAALRLPARAGVALATAEVARRVVTFSARTQASALPGFPTFRSSIDGTLGSGPATIREKGALLVAAAAVLRYFQDRGEASRTNGLADPVSLNQFLKSDCDPGCDGFVSLDLGRTADPQVSLWRGSNFVQRSVSWSGIEPTPAAIRDSVTSGDPVIVALTLASGAAHFVVATGVNEAGLITIHDPHAQWGRSTLDAYLEGFTVGGLTIQGSMTGAVRASAAPVLPSSFLVIASAESATVASRNGTCGNPARWPRTTASPGTVPIPGEPIVFLYCNGQEGDYQLDMGSTSSFRAQVLPLGSPSERLELSGQASVAYRLSNESGRVAATVQVPTISAQLHVNAANFKEGLAPGSLASITGFGLRVGSEVPAVSIDGMPALVANATPFEIRFVVPIDAGPGMHTLHISTLSGSVETAIQVDATAPAIFPTSLVRADGTRIDSRNAALRGRPIVLYATGLGRPDVSGSYDVSVLLDDRNTQVVYVGATPEFPGVYQVNLEIPGDFPPSSRTHLRMAVGGKLSDPVVIAIE
ncbi:MAG TPA: hypothetical protein VE621_21130 [Bryobacteraceae bacterium]|nr:hypothetical protein [Bryobacteraceae bacterium]